MPDLSDACRQLVAQNQAMLQRLEHGYPSLEDKLLVTTLQHLIQTILIIASLMETHIVQPTDAGHRDTQHPE